MKFRQATKVSATGDPGSENTDVLPGISRRDLLKSGSFVAAIAMSPTLLAACTAGGDDASATKTLNVSTGGDLPDYDIISTYTYLTEYPMSACYSQLVRFDPNDGTSVIPDLAESIDTRDDVTYAFPLRKDVTFHGGQKFTSADIKYSIDRQLHPAPGIISPRVSLFENIDHIETPDDFTVILHLKVPQPDFLALQATPYNVVYPKSVAEPLDKSGIGMKRIVNGTGPFKLDKHVEGQYLRLVRNEKFYRTGEPKLDVINYFFIPSGKQTAAAIESKRIDGSWFFAVPSITADLGKIDGVEANTRPGPVFVNLISQVQRKPFNDIRVREAMSLALDRSAYIDTVGPIAGAVFTGRGLFPPGSKYSLPDSVVASIPGYDTQKGLHGDIDKNRTRARELLQQAGIGNETYELIARADIPAFRESATFIAGQLKQVGLNIQVNALDVGTVTQRSANGDFQLDVESEAIAGSVPDNILGEGYTSFGSRNFGNWKDPRIDELYRRQSRETDPAKRKALIEQFQVLFMKTFFHINLGFVGYGYAHWQYVKGWNPEQETIYNNMTFSTVYIDK